MTSLVVDSFKPIQGQRLRRKWVMLDVCVCVCVWQWVCVGVGEWSIGFSIFW